MPLQPKAPKMANVRQSPPEAGDIAPRLRFKDAEGGNFDPHDDGIAGRFVLLVFSDKPKAVVASLADAARIADQAKVHVRIVTGGTETNLPVPTVTDPDRVAEKALGLAGSGGTVLIGPNLHIAYLAHDTSSDSISQALQLMEKRSAARVGGLGVPHPPVLVVPDVLSKADCQRLMTVFRTDGNVWMEPGHIDNKALPQHDYKMKIPEYGRKDRVDHWVMNPQTNAFIDDRLRRRLFPEIKKAFQYRVTRREGYRIAYYEGERGGEAKGHRDNTTPQVAHRRFAVSINLNSEEFEGAGIRFLEYGDQHYKPATGEAVVFSSSVLHEVMHVESGHRYVLLGFLFGDT